MGKPHKRNSCTGKVAHSTREEAVNAMLKMARATGTAAYRLRVYRCKNCWIQIDGQRRRPNLTTNLRSQPR